MQSRSGVTLAVPARPTAALLVSARAWKPGQSAAPSSPHGCSMPTDGSSPPGLRRSGTMPECGMCGRLVRVFAIDLVPELVRTGRAHEEVERSRPETVALSDRLQPAYQKVLERNPGAVSDRAEVFVAGVRGRPRGRPQSTGDDPRCSTWFP